MGDGGGLRRRRESVCALEDGREPLWIVFGRDLDSGPRRLVPVFSFRRLFSSTFSCPCRVCATDLPLTPDPTTRPSARCSHVCTLPSSVIRSLSGIWGYPGGSMSAYIQPSTGTAPEQARNGAAPVIDSSVSAALFLSPRSIHPSPSTSSALPTPTASRAVRITFNLGSSTNIPSRRFHPHHLDMALADTLHSLENLTLSLDPAGAFPLSCSPEILSVRCSFNLSIIPRNLVLGTHTHCFSFSHPPQSYVFIPFCPFQCFLFPGMLLRYPTNTCPLLY